MALLLSLIILLVLCVSLTFYLMHLLMVNQDKKSDQKLKYISFFALKKIVDKYLSEGRLYHDPEYRTFLSYNYLVDELIQKYYLAMVASNGVGHVNVFAESHDKFYWHASILRTEGVRRWMDPIGFFLFSLYSLLICKTRDLPEYDWVPCLDAAQTLYRSTAAK